MAVSERVCDLRGAITKPLRPRIYRKSLTKYHPCLFLGMDLCCFLKAFPIIQMPVSSEIAFGLGGISSEQSKGLLTEIL